MKRDERKIVLRCAVYTRVSTDSGLEQDFNSLDNQREASEAYIKSQAHEGWKLVRERYDDGGFSGGSMERPALQKLLDDVRARKIDVIVVYKVDRLTRSLADFAKLVELFDAHSVSFISVTQAFNTTTSMGRLTLNMLLSFAQFEREITGERIRDKVAASKRKGIWMGGAVPLGYRVEDRALHVVEDEAEIVRGLFRRYLEVGSVVRLKIALDAENVRSPIRMSRSGRKTGGVPISRGHLYWILSNPIYVGRLRHKGQIHDGLHPAIVDLETWDRVQEQLKSQTQTRRISRPDDHSFLAGKLYDDRGNRMGASHASKGGRRWRYYVSRAALTGRTQEAGSVVRIPASEIENRITRAVGTHLGVQASAIADYHINHGGLGGNQAITPHEQARRLRTDPPNREGCAKRDRARHGRRDADRNPSERVGRRRGAGSGIDAPLDAAVFASPPRDHPARGRSAATPTSNANESARRFHQSIARRSPLARRTRGRPHPGHRVARHPRGQKRALDPDDAVPCVHLPRPGGSRDGGSASARVLHQAPDRPADALVRAMARDRTAGAGSGSSRTRLIHPASFRAQRILLVVIGRRSASAPPSPSRGPGNGILRAETGGRFQAQNAEKGRNSVRRPQHPSLTDRNCEGFCRPGNRVGLPGLHGGRCRDRTCDPSRVKGVGRTNIILISLLLPACRQRCLPVLYQQDRPLPARLRPEAGRSYPGAREANRRRTVSLP